jgi:hypothetical protein
VKQGAVRRALEKAKEVAHSGTRSALGAGVVALRPQALQALGAGLRRDTARGLVADMGMA